MCELILLSVSLTHEYTLQDLWNYPTLTKTKCCVKHFSESVMVSITIKTQQDHWQICWSVVWQTEGCGSCERWTHWTVVLIIWFISCCAQFCSVCILRTCVRFAIVYWALLWYCGEKVNLANNHLTLLLDLQALSTTSLQKYQRQSRRNSAWLHLLIHQVWSMAIWNIHLMSIEPYCGLVSSADYCPLSYLFWSRRKCPTLYVGVTWLSSQS